MGRYRDHGSGRLDSRGRSILFEARRSTTSMGTTAERERHAERFDSAGDRNSESRSRYAGHAGGRIYDGQRFEHNTPAVARLNTKCENIFQAKIRSSPRSRPGSTRLKKVGGLKPARAKLCRSMSSNRYRSSVKGISN